MAQPEYRTVIRELQSDLARKYQLHGPNIETLWKNFTKAQRTKAMKDGAKDGVVLKHRMDHTQGVVCKLIPEWNLRDVTESADFLPNLLRYRATANLMEQYQDDHAHISNMMQTRNLRHIDEARLSRSFTVFLDDGDNYGRCYTVPQGVDRKEALAGFEAAFQAGLCIPQSTAEFIFMRQSGILQTLNIIIEDILDIGSKTRAEKQERPSKSTDTAAAMAKLSIQSRPTKLSLADLFQAAKDQKAAAEEYLYLLAVEPVVLAHAVNTTFFSRPELVPDEKGRCLPVHTDRFISSALFDAIHGAVKGAATWTYLCRLLELLQDSKDDKVRRAIVLQEISNTCHFEYGRTQSLLKRHVQLGTGEKYFQRISNVFDKGNARVSMKIKPEELTRAEPQLHYILRLCKTDTNPTNAVQWLEKLGALHNTHPEERDKLSERELSALWNHAAIVAFMQDLSPAISMPPLSRKKGQLFVSRSNELEAELNNIRDAIDLRQFVVPIDNLREPGVAPSALKALDDAIINKTGAKLGFIYQDLIQDCTADLEKQYQKIQAKPEPTTEWVQYLADDPQVRTERRRQKEKTRPNHSSLFELIQQPPATVQEDASTIEPGRKFVVKKSTADVFSTLFDKSESRSPISWASFEAALADLGFSVIPKYGSVYTFLPPETMAVKRSLTLHRPHRSSIEGWLVHVFARRLNRLYGWDRDTFRVE